MEGSVICRKSCNQSTEMLLQYEVICTEDPIITDERYRSIYSLLIIKSESFDDRETLFLFDISRSRERAENIAKAFRENHVTPCTALDILDDVL